MKIDNLANLSKEKFIKLKRELVNLKTLGQVLAWTRTKPKEEFLPHIVAESIAQDEYTIDVIIPFSNVFLVFDTT